MKVKQIAENCISIEKDGVCILADRDDAEKTAWDILDTVRFMNTEPTQESIEAEIGEYEYKGEKEL